MKPYYCKVEYLESTGTQWINTGYLPNQNTVLKQKVRKTNNVSAAFSFVRWSGSPNYDTFGTYWSGGAGLLIYYGRYANSKTQAIAAVVDTDYDISIDIDKIVVNENSFPITRGTVEWTNTLYPLYLFAGNNNGAASFQIAGRIYYCQIIENDVLLHDFIPVLDNNKRPALYDRITKTLFYNQGSGEFSTGNEISETRLLKSNNKLYFIKDTKTRIIRSSK